ncbi:MAG TPA: DUF2089 domain-containing protein [Actinomycetota bacterium]|nr:DUF2089 domain-containing protein [Actinomycetota bacterium]
MTGLPTPPSACPVCTQGLILTRLTCPSCHTEISGTFAQCRFCQLNAEDKTLLEVFLRSRGNMRDVQSHLGVSYPTARQRFHELLGRLGLDEPVPDVDDVIQDLQAGRLSVAEAQALLENRQG